MTNRTQKGFTLAELLIALAILAEIATFTIPKVITAQQNGTYNARAKEVAGMISEGYQQYRLRNTVTTSSGSKDITPYMNYIATTTTDSIDDVHSSGSLACNIYGGICLKLHNGGYLLYWPNDSFGGNSTLNAVPFVFDPDGRITDGTTNGPGKSIRFFIYINGKIRDDGTIDPNTTYYSGVPQTWNPTPSNVPSWFSW